MANKPIISFRKGHLFQWFFLLVVNGTLLALTFHLKPVSQPPRFFPVYNAVGNIPFQIRLENKAAGQVISQKALPGISRLQEPIVGQPFTIHIEPDQISDSTASLVAVFENFGWIRSHAHNTTVTSFPMRAEFHRTRLHHRVQQAFLLQNQPNTFTIEAWQFDPGLRPALRLTTMSALRAEYQAALFQDWHDNAVFMFFFGVFIVQCLYALLLLLANPRREFMYYLIWSVSVFVLVNCYFGLQAGAPALLGWWPRLKFIDVHATGFPFTTLVYFAFISTFVDLPKNIPKAHRIVTIVRAFMLVMLGTVCLLNWQWPDVERTFLYVSLGMLLTYMPSIYLVFVFFRSRAPVSLFAAVGGAFILTGAIFFFLTALVWPTHPDRVFITEVFRLSMIALEFCCLNLGLLHKLRLEKQAAYRQREQERQRIARDLHDDLGSSIGSIALFGTALQSMEGNARSETQAGLQHIVQSANASLEALHDIVWTIDTRRDRVSDLLLHLRDHLEPLAAAASIALHWHLLVPPNDPPLPPILKKNVWLIFKEATANALRYAHATALRVELTIHHREVQLSIIDNGQGFDLDQVRTEANGLRNMRERVEETGGILQVESSAGRGTTVRARLPWIDTD